MTRARIIQLRNWLLGLEANRARREVEKLDLRTLQALRQSLYLPARRLRLSGPIKCRFCAWSRPLVYRTRRTGKERSGWAALRRHVADEHSKVRPECSTWNT